MDCTWVKREPCLDLLLFHFSTQISGSVLLFLLFFRLMGGSDPRMALLELLETFLGVSLFSVGVLCLISVLKQQSLTLNSRASSMILRKSPGFTRSLDNIMCLFTIWIHPSTVLLTNNPEGPTYCFTKGLDQRGKYGIWRFRRYSMNPFRYSSFFPCISSSSSNEGMQSLKKA